MHCVSVGARTTILALTTCPHLQKLLASWWAKALCRNISYLYMKMSTRPYLSEHVDPLTYPLLHVNGKLGYSHALREMDPVFRESHGKACEYAGFLRSPHYAALRFECERDRAVYNFFQLSFTLNALLRTLKTFHVCSQESVRGDLRIPQTRCKDHLPFSLLFSRLPSADHTPRTRHAHTHTIDRYLRRALDRPAEMSCSSLPKTSPHTWFPALSACLFLVHQSALLSLNISLAVVRGVRLIVSSIVTSS